MFVVIIAHDGDNVRHSPFNMQRVFGQFRKVFVWIRCRGQKQSQSINIARQAKKNRTFSFPFDCVAFFSIRFGFIGDSVLWSNLMTCIRISHKSNTVSANTDLFIMYSNEQNNFYDSIVWDSTICCPRYRCCSMNASHCTMHMTIKIKSIPLTEHEQWTPWVTRSNVLIRQLFFSHLWFSWKNSR